MLHTLTYVVAALVVGYGVGYNRGLLYGRKLWRHR